jgi:hypothetical protein
MIRKGQAYGSAAGAKVTASFSVCSRRRTELPIIYADFRLDYKFATLPNCRLESKLHTNPTI